MDLQPEVSTTPPHAFAAVSTALPQRHRPGTPVYLQLPVTTFSPLTEVASPSNLQVVARLELCGSSGRVQPLLLSTFFFFFFLWVREVALPPKPWRVRGGKWSPVPQQLTSLWSGAPSSGTACSLELSLLSPAGIWFKTLLPVGGTNTAALLLKGDVVSRHLRGNTEFHRRLQRPGVWGSPTTRAAAEYPLNLWGASCPTLAMVTPACG